MKKILGWTLVLSPIWLSVLIQLGFAAYLGVFSEVLAGIGILVAVAAIFMAMSLAGRCLLED